MKLRLIWIYTGCAAGDPKLDKGVTPGPRSLDCYLDVATYLAKRLDETRVEDILVETENRPPAEIATEVLKRVGWLS